MAWAAGLAFDDSAGPSTAWIYPEAEGDVVDGLRSELPFVCLAENTSSIEATDQEARASCFLARVGGATLFGASVMRSERTARTARGGRHRAVAVLSEFPAWDLLEERVLALSVLALDHAVTADEKRALVEAVAAAAPGRCGGGDFASGVDARALRAVGARGAVAALRLCALGGRVVTYSASPAAASRAALAIASLLPAYPGGAGERGTSYGTLDSSVSRSHA